MLKVGITGAAGNVGSTLRRGLTEKYELSLFDIREIKPKDKEQFRVVDFSNEEDLKGQFEGLDVLIHLAGDPAPNAPKESTLKNNFRGTSFAFEEAKRAGVKKIIFASSNFYHQGSISEILQSNSKEKIYLDTFPTPQCMYAASKVYGENLGLHLSNYGIQFAAMRIGWTISEDNPKYYRGKYMSAVYCSQRDLITAFDKAIEKDYGFLAAFVVSDNKNNVFDMKGTNLSLGFSPEDSYDSFF